MLDEQLWSQPRGLGDAVARGAIALDDALQEVWRRRAAIPGLMRSDLSRMVRASARSEDGTDGRFVVQANPGRATRRAPARSFAHVVTAFDPQPFHFAPGRVRGEEILLELELDAVRCELLANVSPFGLCHSLVVVDPSAGLPQVLQEQGLRAGLALVRGSAREDLKVGFNSLCACATVNHLHLHCLYFRGAGVERDRMPVELASDGAAVAPGVTRLAGYPIGAWRIRGPQMVGAAAAALRVLQSRNTPHNVLIGPHAITLIPRVSQAEAGEAAGLAFLELSGELLVVCGNEDDPAWIAGGMKDAEVERRIGAASLAEQVFATLEQEIARALGA